MLFTGVFRSEVDNRIKERKFIAKITRVNNDIKLVNFNPNDIFGESGNRTIPVRRVNASHSEFKYLDYVYFKDIIKTAKEKADLITKETSEKVHEKELKENLRTEIKKMMWRKWDSNLDF